MNEKIKKITQNPKLLIAFGIGGILLIFLSSFFASDKSDDTKQVTDGSEYTAEQYCKLLESNVKSIVTGITGDKKCTVVITLESGVRYAYASADETDTSSATGSTSDQSSQSKKQSYITVKNADGSEQALIVTEIMPEVRGVAIICNGGNNEIIAEKIKNSVTSALNITSKRVYISGGRTQ